MNNRLLTERVHYYAPAIHIGMAVTIAGEPTSEEMKAAIRKALAQHEIFSSRVVMNEQGEGYYERISEPVLQIEERINSEEEEWKRIIYEQERIPFRFHEGELIRFFLLRKEAVLQLVVVAHHLSGDGLAMIYLIRDIMEALGNPEIDRKQLPIRLCTKEDFPKESKISPQLRLMVRLFNGQWKRKGRIFSYEDYLSMFHQYWSKRTTSIVNGYISGDELKKLLLLCKQHHITMNSAITTAFSMAIKCEKEIGLAVNVRPEGYEGMGNFASGISFEYEPDFNLSFWDNALRIQEELHKRIRQSKKKYFVFQFMGSMEPTLIDALYFQVFGDYQNSTAKIFSDMFRYSGNPRGIGISNLTKLDIPELYGKYTITHLDFVPPVVANARRLIGVATLGDTMSITMNSEDQGNKEIREQELEATIRLLKSLT